MGQRGDSVGPQPVLHRGSWVQAGLHREALGCSWMGCLGAASPPVGALCTHPTSQPRQELLHSAGLVPGCEREEKLNPTAALKLSWDCSHWL